MSVKQKKTVYFVRHGQSIDNTLPVLHSKDSPLSETGKQQAKDLAQRLATVNFEIIISSPLPRAKETASYISESSDKKVIYSDLFIERRKPEIISGKPWADMDI